MKTILTALLFCLLLESILSTKITLKMKKDNPTKAIKDIKGKNLRKLDETESMAVIDYPSNTVEEFSTYLDVQTSQPDGQSSSKKDDDHNYNTAITPIPPIPPNNGYISPYAEDYNDNPFSNQSENINATAKDSFVNQNKNVSQKGYKIDNKSANIHFMKFHSFTKEKEQGKIKFKTLFYFFDQVIPYSIIYRLRITYNSKLRNLQTGTAESVRTDCIITNKNLVGSTVPDGVKANYDCSANANGDSTISNIQLNTDVNMVFAYENGTIKEDLDFNKVSFEGIASEESKNIQENKETIKSQAYLKDTTVSIGGYYRIIFRGKFEENSLRRRLTLSNGKNISMNFKTKKNNQDVTLPYNCDFYQSNNNAELQCDTASNPIDTTIENLHLSNGQSDDGTFFTIEMLNWQTNKTQIIAENKISKSSDGLSEGAIAAIVIACVVGLVAVVLVTIIVLRKPPLNQPAALERNYDSSAHVIN